MTPEEQLAVLEWNEVWEPGLPLAPEAIETSEQWHFLWGVYSEPEMPEPGPGPDPVPPVPPTGREARDVSTIALGATEYIIVHNLQNANAALVAKGTTWSTQVTVIARAVNQMTVAFSNQSPGGSLDWKCRT